MNLTSDNAIIGALVSVIVGGVPLVRYLLKEIKKSYEIRLEEKERELKELRSETSQLKQQLNTLYCDIIEKKAKYDSNNRR